MRKTAAPILFRCLSNTLAILCAAGCVAAPPCYEEYTIARSAVKSAYEVDSARFATGLWNRADENYRAGERAFKEAEFDTAKKFFNAAKDFAERAENATRLKKFQTGDSFP